MTFGDVAEFVADDAVVGVGYCMVRGYALDFEGAVWVQVGPGFDGCVDGLAVGACCGQGKGYFLEFGGLHYCLGGLKTGPECTLYIRELKEHTRYCVQDSSIHSPAPNNCNEPDPSPLFIRISYTSRDRPFNPNGKIPSPTLSRVRTRSTSHHGVSCGVGYLGKVRRSVGLPTDLSYMFLS